MDSLREDERQGREWEPPRAGEAIEKAGFSLADVERKGVKRKLFEGDSMKCDFCAKRGHDVSFLPAEAE